MGMYHLDGVLGDEMDETERVRLSLKECRRCVRGEVVVVFAALDRNYQELRPRDALKGGSGKVASRGLWPRR
jgi:hypothetical protein